MHCDGVAAWSYRYAVADLTQVSKIILGVMQYGSGQDWMITDHDEGVRQMK